MPNIVSDMNALIKSGDAVFDKEKKHYVDNRGVRLVSFQDVASGRYRTHVEEPLVDYDEPEPPTYIPNHG